MQARLQKAISRAVEKITGLDLKPADISIFHPENEEFGDFSSNIALVLAKKVKKNPLELAKLIVQELKDSGTMKQCSNIKIAAPGFINITLKKDWLVKELGKIIEQGDKYAQLDLFKGKRIMVEFGDPNTHKAFHIGHLRNVTIGESLIRILEASGYEVVRANYQGDVGMHIAKAIYGLTWILLKEKKVTANEKTLNDFKRLDKSLREIKNENRINLLGKAYAKGAALFEENPIARTVIGKINKIIYNKGKDVGIYSKYYEIYQLTRQWSLDYFEIIYKRLGSHYDRYYFESEVFEPGRQNTLKGLKKGIFEKSQGAIIFPGKKQDLHDRVFITHEGYPTYEGKDMGLGILQYREYHPEIIIRVVGPEQASYFQVVFTAQAQLFPELKNKFHHVIAGWIRLKKGKMSSRSGKVILGEWLLDEAKKRIKKSFPKVSEQTAEMIAVGAVKYSFLKVSPSTEVTFGFKESISLEGNSGPYLQYTYCRCQSVLQNVKAGPLHRGQITGVIVKARPLHPLNEEELVILRTLYKFPEIIKQAGETYSPNLICNFLYDLAQKYNVFYNKHRIIQDKKSKDKDQEQLRLTLTAATSQTLKNGLYLLGIKTPRQM